MRALAEVGVKPSDEIEVLIPSRPLTHDEFRRILIRDNLNYGAFDYDILAADYEADELIEYGMSEKELFEPPPVKDSSDKDATPDSDVSDTILSFGKYRTIISRDEYLLWEEQIRQQVGFDEKSIIAEMRKRIGMP